MTLWRLVFCGWVVAHHEVKSSCRSKQMWGKRINQERPVLLGLTRGSGRPLASCGLQLPALDRWCPPTLTDILISWEVPWYLDTFTFQNGSSVEIVCAVFSYPPTVLLGCLGNIHRTKNKTQKWRLKINLIYAFSAIYSSRWTKTSKSTICFSTRERSPTGASSVVTQASVCLIWKSTCWFILGRSLLFAHIATTPADRLATWRITC